MSNAIWNCFLLFGSTYVVVLALGLQSQLVNNGHYALAFMNSLLIGASNLVLFRLAPEATGIEVFGYLTGGPFGIVSSMILYRKVISQGKLEVFLSKFRLA